MTIDERIVELTTSQEKTQVPLAQIVDSIQRLERIALSPEIRLQDTETALAALEGRNTRTEGSANWRESPGRNAPSRGTRANSGQ